MIGFLKYVRDRFVPRAFRSLHGFTMLALFGLSAAASIYWRNLVPDFVFQAIMGALLVGFVLAKLYDDFKRNKEREDIQEAKILDAETKTEEESEFPEYFQSSVTLVAERARLVMIKAEGRANLLYGVGTLLTVLSVMAPFISLAAYLTTSPLTKETMDLLEPIRDANGAFPDAVSITANKDWRILFAGISTGFLFIAATSAIFAQHRRQTETFLGLARDVDYYDGVAGAIDLRDRADSAEITPKMSEMVEKVIELLLGRPEKETKKDSKEQSGTPDAAQLIGELIKQAKIGQ